MRNNRSLWLAVLILLGVVGWLAYHFPHNSLWYDEALTTYVATDSWQTLIRWCTQVDIQVPFHYIVLRLWTGLVGDSEFTLRLLSALCVVLAAAGAITVGRQLTRRWTVGYATAILLTATPGMLWLAYEVRAYALAIALYVWATAFLCRLLNPQQRNRGWLIVGYALLMLAALYTHYTAIAGFAAHLAILGIIALAQRSHLLLTTLVAIVLVGIGFAPWLPTLLTRSAADRSYYLGNPIPPDRAVAVMLGFKLLGREDAPDSANTLVIGYLALMVLGAMLSVRRWRAALTGLMIAVWPVAITAALVYFKPKLAGRYVWPAWLGFDLLVALLIAVLVRWQRIIGSVVLAVLIVIPWLFGELGHPPDSDFRAAYAYLCTYGDPHDVVLLRDGTLFVVDRYYGRRAPCDSQRYAIAMPPAEMTNVEEALTLPAAQQAMRDVASRQPPNVWVVSWQGDVMDPQELAYGLLDGASNHSVVDMQFGDVRLDRFEKPQPILSDPVANGQAMNVTPIANGPTLQAVRLISPDSVHRGDVIVLQAWWTRGATLQPALRVSVRIMPLDGGKPYVQVDQPPSAWKYVDDRWQVGVPALGRYELKVDQNVPLGKVAIGYVIYDANGGWEPIILKVGEITLAN
jgi:mannosyltransferase